MGRATKHIAMKRKIIRPLPKARTLSPSQKRGKGSSRNGIHQGYK